MYCFFNGTYRMVAISPARPQREDEVGQRVQAGLVMSPGICLWDDEQTSNDEHD
jgi:hypothetical protein